MSDDLAVAQPSKQLRGKRKVVNGVVSSDKMKKTIVVRVDWMVMHPKFKKYVRRHTKHYAHDEQCQAVIGDRVEIIQTRPLSKLKRWRLLRVMGKGENQ